MKEQTRVKNSEKAVRIRQIRDYFCFGNNTDFSKKLGVSTNQGSALCCGKQSIGLESIEKVLNAFPEVSRHWLMTGEGPMLNPSRGAGSPSDVRPMDGESTDTERTSTESTSNLLPSFGEVIAMKNEVIVTLQSKISTMQAYIDRLEKTLQEYEN